MKRFFILIILLLTFQMIGKAQEEEKKFLLTPDLHFRTFWMNTNYPGLDFKEDFALGMSFNLGTVLSYQNRWKFHFGYRTFANVASSEIWSPDPITGQPNRYETGLFDLLDTRDRSFGKLETISIEYSAENFGVKVGRMGINSEWINAQDGRLSPTAIEGIYAWFEPNSLWKFSVWGIGRMSIRGSKDWLSVGETVGIFPSGRAVSGKPAQYFGNTSSDWIGIWEVDRKNNSGVNFHFSNTIAQNLYSTYMLSIGKNPKVEHGTMIFGLQSGFQHGIGKGGNENAELKYKKPEDKNYSLSGRIGWKNSNWIAHLNYTRVSGKGRWLNPREWGKDAWYTFVPRERNEGYQSVDALMVYGEYGFKKAQISIYGHLGFHWLPDTENAAANKYNFPSYRQVNLGFKYEPKKIKDLDIHLLIVNKEALDSVNLTPNQIYNKVGMLHFNGIINWRWH